MAKRRHIYPYDITLELKKTGFRNKSERTNFFIGMLITAVVILSLVIARILDSYISVSFTFSFIVSILIIGSIGFVIYNRFIFKIDEKIIERELEETESFSRFYRIEKDSVEVVPADDRGRFLIPVQQVSSGDNFVAFRLRYSKISDKKAANNAFVLKEVFKLIHERGASVQTVDSAEIFSKSDEYQEMLKTIEKTKNPALKEFNYKTFKRVVDLSEERCTTSCTTVRILGRGNMNELDFGFLMYDIINVLNSRDTSFRSLEILSPDKYNSFIEEYNSLEALDLTLINSLDLDNDDGNYSSQIKIYSIKGKSGTIYGNEDIIDKYLKSDVKEV